MLLDWLRFTLLLKFDSLLHSWMPASAKSSSSLLLPPPALLAGFDLACLHLPSDLEPGPSFSLCCSLFIYDSDWTAVIAEGQKMAAP